MASGGRIFPKRGPAPRAPPQDGPGSGWKSVEETPQPRHGQGGGTASGWKPVDPAAPAAPMQEGQAGGWREVQSEGAAAAPAGMAHGSAAAQPTATQPSATAPPASPGGDLYVADGWVVAGARRWHRNEVHGAAVEHRRTGHLWGIVGVIVTGIVGVLVTEEWDLLPMSVARPVFAAPLIGSAVLAFRGLDVSELVLATPQGRVVAARHNGKDAPPEWVPFVQALQQR